MKKIVVLLIFSLAINSSLFAQKNLDKKVNSYVETVESKTTLTSKEKETITAFKKTHLMAIAEISKNYEKGSSELKEKRRESNKQFSKSLTEAFGKQRAKEIVSASKKNKKNKKKKK